MFTQQGIVGQAQHLCRQVSVNGTFGAKQPFALPTKGLAQLYKYAALTIASHFLTLPASSKALLSHFPWR